MGTTTNTSSVLAIIFGVTGGVLALVGLVSIFASLSTQQIIQKLRDVWWKIQELSMQLVGEIEYSTPIPKYSDIKREIRTSLKQYEHIYDQHKEIPIVGTEQAFWTILIVCFLWFVSWLFLYANEKSLNKLELTLSLIAVLFGIAILVSFLSMIDSLKNPIRSNNCPKPPTFYDAYYQDFSKFNTLAYAASSLELILVMIKDHFALELRSERFENVYWVDRDGFLRQAADYPLGYLNNDLSESQTQIRSSCRDGVLTINLIIITGLRLERDEYGRLYRGYQVTFEYDSNKLRGNIIRLKPKKIGEYNYRLDDILVD